MTAEPESIEFWIDFVEETKDFIDKAKGAHAKLVAGGVGSGGASEAVQEIYRAVHTVKGNAGIFSLEGLVTSAHAFESFLNDCKARPDAMGAREFERIGEGLQEIGRLLVRADEERRGSSATAGIESGVAGVEQIRVPAEKIQSNLDYITEVFLVRNQMAYLVSKYADLGALDARFVAEWEVLDNALRRSVVDLEGIAMGMRMMPVAGLFARMEANVRQYIGKSGKKIRFSTQGGGTEIDKRVLDSLSEPLIHLVRNSMDHGIESPGDRKARGKDETGTIRLSARIAGNEVHIEVQDDGKGIDPRAVKEAAWRKGLDVSGAVTDEQCVELIFLPGFSTASGVSDISGRGVGTDAVKKYVESVGGRVQVSTRLGEGTTFTLTLPLGLSVVPALLTRVGAYTYAVPTGEIVGVERLDRRDLLRNGNEAFLPVGEKLCPLTNLEDLFGSFPDAEELARGGTAAACIVRTRDGDRALMVTEIVENTEVVIKPLPQGAPRLDFLIGVTILPTGEPSFVLSPRRLAAEPREHKDVREVFDGVA